MVLLRELAPLEFVDPTNAVQLGFEGDQAPVRTSQPLALPATKDVAVLGFTVVNKDQFPESADQVQGMMEGASLLAVFNPLGDAARVRNLFSTEIAVAVESTESEWRRNPKGAFDQRFVTVWDEFVRTYHMVTADVRPPLWGDGHRLVVPKQGWVPYDEADAKLPSAGERLTRPLPSVPMDRHQIVTAYAQEGTFSFDPARADQVIRRFFSEGKPVPLARETLSGALRAVDLFRSGKSAVIEGTIAMEIAVSEVVREEKLKRGVSKKKLDEYRREVGLAYQLNVDLPMILAPLTDEERGVIGEADHVRRRRNDIVHEGAQPGRDEGQRAVKAVRNLLDMLRSRGYKV